MEKSAWKHEANPQASECIAGTPKIPPLAEGEKNKPER